jgi:predicted cupin superfamily sugar epimerase
MIGHEQAMTEGNASYWIGKLGLTPHPEGGYYRQTYRSELSIEKAGLPAIFGGSRAASTAIYFLLEAENFSAFHRLQTDEVWHFYAGQPLVVHVLERGGACSRILLGRDPEAGQVLQAVVRGGHWFASHVADWKSWALVGCTVAPGFEFEDFEMGEREELTARYPQHGELIERLTRSLGRAR